MPISHRTSLAAGLSLVGLVALAVRSPAQQSDGDVRKANGQQPPATATATTPAPLVVGTIDMDAVLLGYDKVKTVKEKMKLEFAEVQKSLAKIADEGQATYQELQRQKPGSVDHQRLNNKLTELKAKLKAEEEKKQQELSMREMNAWAEFTSDIQKIAKAVAKQRGITLIIRTSADPLQDAPPNPDTVTAALARSVIYSDASFDITKDVVKYLNFYYQKTHPSAAGGAGAPAPAPKAAAGPTSTKVK